MSAPDLAALGPAFREHVRHRLEARKVGFTCQFPGEFFRDGITVDVSRDGMFDTVAMRMVSYVLSDQLVHECDEVTVDVPASWWQHFKRDVLSRYRVFRRYVRRHPVEMRTLRNLVSFDRYRIYPQADVMMPRTPYGMPQYHEAIVQKGWQG